jgi:hypothetical protein
MKWLWTTLPVVSLALVLPCQAENNPKLNSNSNSTSTIGITPGELAPTQEMWFYEQYQKQHTDPKVAVRQQAEFRFAERQRRIAALRWYGFSNQRPAAGCDPVHDDLGVRWTSGNANAPGQWNGPIGTTLLVKPSAAPTRGY